ncbi:MAG: HD domain-containing protein [Phycisphaeraceae bacterium]|nr:MAG: HD domain-containing protein [Phycisphaeraceae bacterium]
MFQDKAMADTPQETRRYIRDLGPSEQFDGAFTIGNAQLGTTRNGKPYLRCLLSDRTGELPGRMWSCPEELFNRLPTDGFVYVHGETQPYQGELQLIIHSIEPIEPSDAQLTELLPSSERPAAEMFAELVGMLDNVKHPAMKALIKAYLDDEMLMDQFRKAPAAKMMHHAYLGGLLEHTLNLLKLAEVVCPLYPQINRELVLVGLFLHDLGKTRELQWEKGFGYTDRGQLVGHIVDGAIMLHDKAQQAMRESGVRPPAHAITVLQHIILSHHTLPEYGAAKVPSTPEAILVAMLDNLDAKTTIALMAAKRGDRPAFDLGGNFTDKQWALANTRLFRPDPLGP